ncbi:MAG: tetratricopeptide repeat protein [Phocaeicola sp.]|uniref:tetratricopeptide repeat protein n=1 Tax=Phocaeicola TaxID=909656 RepID=UPI00234E5574|nr:tetratricopeptide repeat protein [Phocaeicola oris]MCE2616648.1 tetratricopeptide repeat protein [Phocaeicola oris]
MKKKIFVTMAMLALLYVLPVPAQIVSDSYPLLKDRVVREMEDYNYEQVINLVSADTQDSLLLTYKAKAQMAINRYRDAISSWSALPDADSNIQSLVHIGDCYRSMGNYLQAANYYHRVSDLKPENSFFRSLHVRSLLNANDLKTAIEATHQWLDRDSTSAEAFKYLGMAYEGQDDVANAFLAYNRAYRLDSLDQQTVAHIAGIFLDNNQVQDAIDLTENYRKSDTTGIDVNRQNAKAYCLNKDFKTAILRYESLKRAGDRSFTTYYYLGMSYYGDNWYYGAYDNLKEAHRLSPNDVGVLYYYGMSAASTSWKDEGADMLDKAVELSMPNDSVMCKVIDASAVCDAKAGRYKEEIERLKALYSLTKDYYIYYRIGRSYDYGLKDYSKAVAAYEKYMSMVPEERRVARLKDGTLVENALSNYQVAERRIKEIKEEKFFRDGFTDKDKLQK